MLLHLIDAFADRPFAGNPAAVCFLDREQPADEWLRAVAAEMNQAETAFLQHAGNGYRLRWFTPVVEVDLCGHATLASAHFLWQAGLAPRGATIPFETRSGLLSATPHGEEIELDFPAAAHQATNPPRGLAAALGVEVTDCWQAGADLLVLLPSEADVRRVAPDFAALAKIPTRGIIITSLAADASCDFVSRFFAPAYGIPEDPVTGSAHCALGPFWSARLGKTELVGRQLSRRGGVVCVRLAGNRAFLRGRAITTLRGELIR